MDTIRCPYCHENVAINGFEEHKRTHLEKKPDGQQTDYATLPPEDRLEGDLTGVPTVYVHQQCGAATGMPDEIVRSYIKNPFLYMSDSTFCTGCEKHVPIGECIWADTGENLQSYMDSLRAKKPELRPAQSQLPAGNPDQQQSGFSFMRIGGTLGAILLVSAALKLPGILVKNAAQQQGQPAQQVTGNLQSANNQLQMQLQRGDDMPEAVLMLAGIDPDDYKKHQINVRTGEVSKEAVSYEQQGDYKKSLEVINRGIAEYPDSARLHNGKAWLMATCPDHDVRDGAVAIEHANIACELTDWSNAGYVDSLAAAQAEAGDFDAAVETMQRAIGLTEDDDQKMRFEQRLGMFRKGERVRKGVVPAASDETDLTSEPKPAVDE